MRIVLIVAAILEFLLALFTLTSIASDIQIIIVISLVGFGLTHLGLALSCFSTKR